jgi:hypothetical protein
MGLRNKAETQNKPFGLKPLVFRPALFYSEEVGWASNNPVNGVNRFVSGLSLALTGSRDLAVGVNQ